MLTSCRVGNGTSANLKNRIELPIQPDIRELIKKQGWISDEYEHLWRRDGGGSAALTSHGILSTLVPFVPLPILH